MTDYGLDLSCVDDLTPGMVEVTGRIVLAQAIARRLMTPRGYLCDDPTYGYDVTQRVNDDMSARDLAMLYANVRNECLKDERVMDAAVTGTLSSGVLLLTITLTDGDGPFALVLGVTNVDVTILRVT